MAGKGRGQDNDYIWHPLILKCSLAIIAHIYFIKTFIIYWHWTINGWCYKINLNVFLRISWISNKVRYYELINKAIKFNFKNQLYKQTMFQWARKEKNRINFYKPVTQKIKSTCMVQSNTERGIMISFNESVK